MSEIQTPPQEYATPQKPEDDDIIKKAVNFFHRHPKKIAATAAAVALAVPVGQTVEQGIKDANADAKIAAIQETEQAQHEDFVEALNANYPADSVIGNISIKQGQGLEHAAVQEVGQQVVNANYDTLDKSAVEIGTVQPGDQFAIIDPNKEVENDAIIVPADQVVYSNVTELPTPIIESSPSEKQDQ